MFAHQVGPRKPHFHEGEIPCAQPTTVTSGAINKSDQIEVELHRPADLPAFVLVKWPSAPSVARPDDFSDLVAAVFRVLADAPRRLEQDAG